MPEFAFRKGTLDRSIIKEDDYRNLAVLNSGDRWIDIGAHIGTFCVRAAPYVKHIEAYEPEAVNYGLLEWNIAKNAVPNVRPHRLAVVGDDAKTRSFYLHPRGNTAGHSLLHLRGFREIEVPCVNINDVLGGIDCIKMDVEGGEKELLWAIQDWTSIKQIVLEYHFRILGRSKTDYAATCALLRSYFNEVQTQRHKSGNYFFLAARVT